MNTRNKVVVLIMLAALLLSAVAVMAATSNRGVVPTLFETGPGGNVECSEVGDYEFSSGRLSGGSQFGGTAGPITWTTTDNKYVSWEGVHGGLAVILKGSNAAHVYTYDATYTWDSGLASPEAGGSGQPADLSNITFCWNPPPFVPLTAEKDAAGTYDRTVTWELVKTVDPDSHTGFAGELAGSSLWTVVATKAEVESNFKVTGTITVFNSNNIPVSVSVADELNDSTGAAVDCGGGLNTGIVPANGSLECSYTAFPAGKSATLNTATITSLTAGVDGAVATAPVSFVENLIGFDSGTLSDPRFEYSELISASKTKTFDEDFDCPADASLYEDGSYSFDVVNTAYLNDNIDLEASATVTVECTLPALEVEKTAAGEWDRTVEWELEKSVDPASHTGAPGDTFDSLWTVVATKIDSGPENFLVTGTITIVNPAAIDQTFSVSDVLDDGTVATVECPSYTVLAGDSVVCTYEAEPDDASAELNTATVSAAGNEDQVATADVEWTENLDGYDEGTLTDERFGYEEVIDDSTTKLFPETFECPADLSDYEVELVNGLRRYSFEFTEVNTAFLNDNIDLEASAEVDVTCEFCEQFKGETAWAANGDDPGELRYTPRGNWATYVKYEEKTTTLFAGQTIPVGTVTFSAVDNGEVTITIVLTGDWELEDVSESVKIQGYDSAPSGNPAPGQFTTYKGEELTVTVPAFDYYGVHVNVGQWVEVDCPE